MIKQLITGTIGLAAMLSPAGVGAATTTPGAPAQTETVARPTGEVGFRNAALTTADDRKKKKRRAAALLLPAGGAAVAAGGGGAVAAGSLGVLLSMLGAIVAFDDDAGDAVSP